MKIQTSELTGAALDWAVWSIEFKDAAKGSDDLLLAALNPDYTPSTNWAQAGPIIEREIIDIGADVIDGKVDRWGAMHAGAPTDNSIEWAQFGPTPLVAAMRCYVASKLGDEVELPEDLACRPT